MRKGAVPILLAATLVMACGESSKNESGDGSTSVEPAIKNAAQVRASDFPAVRGRSLQQIANLSEAAAKFGLGTSVYTPGRNRLAFGILDNDNTFAYGKTAVYVGRGPKDVPLGPFPAPADSLIVDPAFRSQTSASSSGDITGIYGTELPLRKPGKYAIVSLTKIGGKLVGATTGLTVQRNSAIPDPGEKAPNVQTDTLVNAHGNVKSIDTRVPPDDMHDVDLRKALGKQPVALLFATPQLCQSRVCAPVVDIEAQMKKTYGDRMQFIHQEVYVGNDARKGYRPSLRAFGLQTEPWLFTIDKSGRIAARLEGSFGIDEFRRAIERAIR